MVDVTKYKSTGTYIERLIFYDEARNIPLRVYGLL